MNRLKELRLARGLTKEQLAHETGISRPIISYLESGKRQMRIQHAKVLAPYFDVTIDYIMGSDAIYYSSDIAGGINNLVLEYFDSFAQASTNKNLDPRSKSLYTILDWLTNDDLSDEDLLNIKKYIAGIIAKKGDEE